MLVFRNSIILSLSLAVILLFKTEAQQPIPTSTGKNNVAYKWGDICMTATANDTEKFNPRPTVTSRYLGLIWTAVFDAWTRYDKAAIPLYLKTVKRRPLREQNLKNKETAISYAAYRTMMHYFVSDSLMLRNAMKEFGLDPDDHSLDSATAVGIGNLAAKTVIEARRFDGSNETGTIKGSTNQPYSDYTGYTPVNNADSLTDLKRWQPKYFSDPRKGKFAPGCLTPHWQKVIPLLLDSANQFRPGPPPALGSEKLKKELKQVIELQANLTDEQKALVEFMRDGPKSVQQAGHWFMFAQNISARDNHSLDEDVKMFFLIEAAAMDAFIACWDAKMFYDYARPYSMVHHYYKDQVITLWGGPGKGMIQVKGQEWRPYSPESFLCPPFPSYVSGHSTVSGACAEALRLFTGSDRFGEEVKRVPGEFTDPDNVGDTVTLKFPTFSKTADLAGISRVLGGYHIQADNLEGLKLGRKVTAAIWRKYLWHVGEAQSNNKK